MTQKTDLNPMQQAGHDAHFADDEINLFDLLSDLQLQKRWFLVPLLACFVSALLYVNIAKPVYQVTSVVKAASEKELVELNPPQLKGEVLLNKGGSGKVSIDVFSMDVEQAYEQSKQALLSREYRKAFYQESISVIKANGLYAEGLTFEQNFDVFNGLFKISLSNDKKDDEKFIALKFELGNPELAADFLNQYVSYSLDRRLLDVRSTFEHKLSQAIKKLEFDASLIQDKYFTDKARNKLEIEEALSIAKAIGLKDSIYQKSGVIGNVQDFPRYMYGEKALAAEGFALNSRERLAKDLPYGEAHFIESLPEISFQIKKLKELKIDFSKVKLAKIDELATLPRKPIKPKKMLILALSLVAGSFLGLMMALLVAAYKRYQKERE